MNQRRPPNEEFWQRNAVKLSRRVNLAWFLQLLSTPLLIGAVVCAVSILVVRREFMNLDPWILYSAVSTFLAFIVIAVGILAMRRFERPEQSLVRIEAAQKMDSALSAASAGVRPWPDAPAKLSDSLSWHLPRTILPPLAALATLALGLFLPISAKTAATPPPSSQPQAWSEIQSQLEKLAEDAMVDEAYIEEMEKRLEELRAQEQEDWFSHSSLEATDSLKETQNSNIDKLERDLSDAKNALNSLTENSGKLDSAQKEKMANDFEEALEGIQNGAMKPNPELLEKLSQIDPQNLGNLTPEQMKQLKENMEKLKESLQNAQQNQGEDWNDQLLGDEGDGDCENGQCQKEGDENDPNKPGNGNGGVDRGPGHDPNVLKNPKDPLEPGELTALEAKDLSRSTPGDLLQLQDGKHTFDNSASVQSAGGEASKGAGGDRVWRESLAPDEQRALKKFFE